MILPTTVESLKWLLCTCRELSAPHFLLARCHNYGCIKISIWSQYNRKKSTVYSEAPTLPRSITCTLSYILLSIWSDKQHFETAIASKCYHVLKLPRPSYPSIDTKRDSWQYMLCSRYTFLYQSYASYAENCLFSNLVNKYCGISSCHHNYLGCVYMSK